MAAAVVVAAARALILIAADPAAVAAVDLHSPKPQQAALNSSKEAVALVMDRSSYLGEKAHRNGRR
jgi:hypothetical protein